VRHARRSDAPATLQRRVEQIAFAAVFRIFSRGTPGPGVLRLSVYDGVPTTDCTPGGGLVVSLQVMGGFVVDV